MLPDSYLQRLTTNRYRNVWVFTLKLLMFAIVSRVADTPKQKTNKKTCATSVGGICILVTQCSHPSPTPQISIFLSLNPNPKIELLNASELSTTLMLLNAMARLAHTGSRRTCSPLLVIGYSTPAATGTAHTL